MLAIRRSGVRLVLAPPALLCLGLLAASLFGSPAVLGQSVPRLSGQITDQAGVLGGGTASLQQALDTLLGERNVQLYAVFVPTSGSATAQQLAEDTFEQNSLGGNDALLLVAVNDRRYGWWEAAGGPLTPLASSTVDALLSSTLEPRFRAGDYAGGVVDFANGLNRALAAPAGGVVVPPAGKPTPAPAAPTAPAPAVSVAPWLVGLLVGLVLIAAGAMILWGAVRRRRQAQLSDEERDRRTGELAREANQLLIAADDAVRDLQQEMGFAEAEFDGADIEPFRTAIGQAQAELKAAFGVRQQLDDDVPEDAATRERMLNEVVAHCRAVAALSEQQRARIAQLRDLERRAPEVLAAVPDQVTGMRARLPAAEAAMQHLEGYAPSSWQPIRGNLEEARKRIDFADAAARRGSAALAAPTPDTGTARQAARAAQTALAQAGTLLDGIDHLAASLDQARDRLGPEIKAAEDDIAAARAALSGQGGNADLASRLAEAEAKLAGARDGAAATAPDVLAGYAAAQQAHAAADQVLAGIRQASEQHAREQAALQSALASAQASVTHAADYIDSRRQGVGREARTRLAEAQRMLEQAQAAAGGDPAGALAQAQQAQRLAEEAYRLASSDFDDWDGTGRRRGDTTGAVIGGIILGSILGGMGRRGGGWGGTPWGMPGGRGGLGGFGRGGGGLGGFGRGGGGGWGGGGRGGGGSW